MNMIVFPDIVHHADPDVARSIKLMTVNTDLETEARIFAPLWGGRANAQALEQKIKHR